MNYSNLKRQIESGLYPNPSDMQGNIDYALKRKKITQQEHEELTALLEKVEQNKYL